MMRPLRSTPSVSPLEPRLVFSAAATGYEQYLLELINRARANPAAEAARLGISLNEGVTGTQITTTAKQPLVMNPNLTQSIRDQVSWLLLNNKFQHEGPGGSEPQDRIAANGYDLSGVSGTAENLGVTLSSSLGDLAQRVNQLYQNLFVDSNVSGRGHRVNILTDAMEEMGAGIASGSNYIYNGQTWTAVLGGQDFAYHAGNSFLTGVVYQDKITPDQFYSPGEGLSGYVITATNSHGASFVTTSDVAGGYSIQLPPGTYSLTARSLAINGGTAQYTGIVLGNQNIERDFELAQFTTVTPVQPPPFAVVSNGTLNITGTSDDDTLYVLHNREDNTIYVELNGESESFDIAAVNHIVINVGAGNDDVEIDVDIVGSTLNGGAGNDTLLGTANNDSIDGGDGDDFISAGGGNDTVTADAGNDTVNGEGGRDLIHGGDGDDRVNGSGGNDSVYGDGGNDRVYGGSGNDYLDGGGNTDRVYGDEGDDTLFGGSSNDRLYGNDGNDVMYGGKGKDFFDGGAGTNLVRDFDHNAGEVMFNAAA